MPDKKYKYKKISVDNTSAIEVLNLLREKFTYDPSTGLVKSISTNKISDKKAGKGYISRVSVRHDNIEYSILPHRLAWFLMTGEMLNNKVLIDHKNQIKDDNKWENLRICNNSENQANTVKRNGNYKGVSTNQYKIKKFTCIICKDDIHMQIGRFEDEAEAAKYYDSAARFYYGEFANCNFNEEFIIPMSVPELRKHKKKNIIEISSKSIRVYQYTLNKVLVKIWNSASEAAKELGMQQNSISQASRGKLKTSGGFIWSLVELN